MLAFRPRPARTLAADAPATGAGAWRADAAPWAIGIREEVMVVEPRRWALAGELGALAERLPPSLRRSVGARPDGRALVVRTGLQASVAEAIGELGALRGRLTAALHREGVRPAAAGAHPQERVTFALHLDVAVADGGRAATAHDRLRAHLPLLLALSANAPFLGGAETGLATVRGAALLDPSQDLRLDSDRGTLTVAICDAQTGLRDVAALAALVQCLTRHEATRRVHRHDRRVRLEAVVDGRDRAAREGMAAAGLSDSIVRALSDTTPHARTLDCLPHLDAIRTLAERPGSTRQRSTARLRPGEPNGGRRLRTLTATLSAQYSAA